MNKTQCDNNEEHNSHEHLDKIETICDGITLCGEMVHAAHTITKQENSWCTGICNCIFISYKHGPGDHK